MEWLYSLFVEHSALQAVVVLSLISAIGLGLGKIHICGISLGVTFVFFAGILAGHFGLSIDTQMLNYAESFGLIIFVYALGLQVGPGFFSSFRKGGVQLNMLALGVVLIGTLMTVLGSYTLDISLPDMVGILCGATTNTPALGAAQQTLKQMGLEASTPALGCAVAYPLGVVGVILAVLIIRKALARKEDLELKEKDDANKTYIAAFQVHNPAIFDKSIKEIGGLNYPKFVISRLWRDGNVSIPTSEKIIREGDRLLVVTSEKYAPALTVLFGEQEHTDWNSRFMQLGASAVQMGSIFVTTQECDASQTFKEVYIHSKPEDVLIIESPVGMPGRAIDGEFIRNVEKGQEKPKCCSFHCIKTCDYQKSPYCIIKALYNAAKGNMKRGYAFAGSNAFLSEKIRSVKEVITTLNNEFLLATCQLAPAKMKT